MQNKPKVSDFCHQVIRGWLARVFHKVEGEEVEVINFCFDTIQVGTLAKAIF